MNFYTEDQVKQMLSNSIDQTMGFAENGGIMNKETAQAIISRSFVHPSTFEIQKQIEAVRVQVKFFNLISSSHHEVMLHDEIKEEIEGFRNSLRTLTATLKPYLNGEKLEV